MVYSLSHGHAAMDVHACIRMERSCCSAGPHLLVSLRLLLTPLAQCWYTSRLCSSSRHANSLHSQKAVSGLGSCAAIFMNSSSWEMTCRRGGSSSSQGEPGLTVWAGVVP